MGIVKDIGAIHPPKHRGVTHDGNHDGQPNDVISLRFFQWFNLGRPLQRWKEKNKMELTRGQVHSMMET